MTEVTILEQIVQDKRAELEATQAHMPIEKLKERIAARTPALDFAAAVKGKGVRLIAEVKRASPSRGVICRDFDPIQIAETYAKNGAAAISVLTESKYFGGSIHYLGDISETLGARRPPLLRKDFIFDEYQIYEARAYGADALLLIVAILAPTTLRDLLGLGRRLGMDCLVEVHSENEVQVALESGADIIGINNRNLNTFGTDLTTTEHLRPLIPPEKTVVSESGIRTAEDIKRLRRCGIDAVLIGEALLTGGNIREKLQELA